MSTLSEKGNEQFGGVAKGNKDLSGESLKRRLDNLTREQLAALATEAQRQANGAGSGELIESDSDNKTPIIPKGLGSQSQEIKQSLRSDKIQPNAKLTVEQIASALSSGEVPSDLLIEIKKKGTAKKGLEFLLSGTDPANQQQ